METAPRSTTAQQVRTAPGSDAVHGPNDLEAVVPEPQPYPKWDAASKTAALHAAERLTRAFARPELPESAWLEQIAPLLSPGARPAYRGTDPANIPAHLVLAEPSEASSSSPFLARVRVRTDAGTYIVLLSRAGRDAPWLGERLIAPASQGEPAR